MSREDSLEIKGIAILMVVISHICSLIEMGGIRSNYIMKLLHPFGYLGVGLFLIVSGYGSFVNFQASHNRWLAKQFMRKRIGKILGLLFPITVVATLVAHSFFNQEYSVFQVLLNGIGLNADIARFTWYIIFQFIWYALFCTATSISYKYWKIFYFVSVIVLYIVSVGSAQCLRSFERVILASMWGLNLFNFPMGVSLARHKAKSDWNKCYIWLIVFSILFAMNYGLLNNPDNPFFMRVVKSLIALSFSLAVYYCPLIGKMRILSCALRKVGKVSYEIYLIHGFLLFTFGQYLFGHGIVSSIAIYIILTFLLVVGVLLTEKVIGNNK